MGVQPSHRNLKGHLQPLASCHLQLLPREQLPRCSREEAESRGREGSRPRARAELEAPVCSPPGPPHHTVHPQKRAGELGSPRSRHPRLHVQTLSAPEWVCAAMCRAEGHGRGRRAPGRVPAPRQPCPGPACGRGKLPPLRVQTRSRRAFLLSCSDTHDRSTNDFNHFHNVVHCHEAHSCCFATSGAFLLGLSLFPEGTVLRSTDSFPPRSPWLLLSTFCPSLGTTSEWVPVALVLLCQGKLEMSLFGVL